MLDGIPHDSLNKVWLLDAEVARTAQGLDYMASVYEKYGRTEKAAELRKLAEEIREQHRRDDDMPLAS